VGGYLAQVDPVVLPAAAAEDEGLGQVGGDRDHTPRLLRL